MTDADITNHQQTQLTILRGAREDLVLWAKQHQMTAEQIRLLTSGYDELITEIESTLPHLRTRGLTVQEYARKYNYAPNSVHHFIATGAVTCLRKEKQGNRTLCIVLDQPPRTTRRKSEPYLDTSKTHIGTPEGLSGELYTLPVWAEKRGMSIDMAEQLLFHKRIEGVQRVYSERGHKKPRFCLIPLNARVRNTLESPAESITCTEYKVFTDLAKSEYSRKRVQEAMQDWTYPDVIRNASGRVVAVKTGVALDEVLSQKAPSHELARKLPEKTIREHLAHFPERTQLVLQGWYLDMKTMREVAELVGVSSSRVQQIIQAAERRIKCLQEEKSANP